MDIARANPEPNSPVGGYQPDYNLAVYEAMKVHFLTTMTDKEQEVETLEEFTLRGMSFKRRLQEYSTQVAEDETVLILSHSRMINVLFETLTKDADSGRYTWGTKTEVGEVYFSEF